MSSSVSGFFLVDKPKGINSFAMVVQLRKILNMRRIGYAGTLDPLASGLMVFAVGEATKILHFLEKMDKVYEVSVTFGKISATYDAEGPFETTNWDQNLTADELRKVISSHFLGERDQMPPRFSAIKINGQRAYHLARKGSDVSLKSRKVTIYEAELHQLEWPRADMNVHCSSGTYIRSFAHELGEKIGCGAYVSELRRICVGRFSIKNAVPFDQLTSGTCREFLRQPQELLSDWPQVVLSDFEYRELSLGRFLSFTLEKAVRPMLAMHRGTCVGLLEPVLGQDDFSSSDSLGNEEVAGDNRKGFLSSCQLKFLRKFTIV